MFVVMIVGKIKSGKDTLAIQIENRLQKLTVQIGFSDPIRECVYSLGLEDTRENLQKTARGLKQEHGPDVFRNAVLHKLEQNANMHYQVAIVSGARFKEDLGILEKYEGILIGVTADEQTRLQRLKADSEDNNLTLEELRAIEANNGTEGNVDALLKRADITIDNSSNDIGELKDEVMHNIMPHIRQYWQRRAKPS